jgi:hypothetical protein
MLIDLLKKQVMQLEFESKLIGLRNDSAVREYKPLASIAFINYKPVIREVFATSFSDRLIHHSIFKHINPIFKMGFIEDTYSCRKGKRYSLKKCSYDYYKLSYKINTICLTSSATILPLSTQ